MNERIKELAAESGIGFLSSVHPSMVEKFAELIIRECAGQCDPEPGLKYSPNAQSSREDCKEKILQLIG